ncbi:hypothetical protein QCN29_20715 [Streptomyces sp. HNM0663]|uniref:Uncharacterized protein n=1 Tax=Streptomyces chengmaiensis TaxID=3040919 RepID=A0ABT6HR22_9ACTN|nr:hypothetical protein [Streptomyces chengmaiensis]MDH2391168.1 hypothetical protein [Streptomyces chengmaiensis]
MELRERGLLFLAALIPPDQLHAARDRRPSEDSYLFHRPPPRARFIADGLEVLQAAPAPCPTTSYWSG